MLQIVDIKRMSEVIKAKKPDVIFAIDNTVLSPYILVIL